MSDHSHAGDHGHSDGHGDEYHSHGKLYFTIFIVLCVFTVVSYLADIVQLPSRVALVGIVMAVAVCKALCVMMVFMHLQFERAWKYLLLAPTLILACTVPFALTPDVGTHYYTVDTPQFYENEKHPQDDGSHGHGEHAPAKAAHP